MKNSIINRLLLLVVLMCISGTIFAQSPRQWWTSLSPAWKKVFLDAEFKGKDINPTDEQLASLMTIEHLTCNGNKNITDLKPLAILTNLKTLDCSNTNIKSLEGIETLRSLVELNCSDNDNINSLIPLQGLGGLEKVNCGNTMVKNLSPLRNLRNLKKLDVHFCTVNSLGGISELNTLVELNVSQNKSLYTLDGMQKLVNLVNLDLSQTNVDNLDPIKDLKSIEVLNVSNSMVASLRPIMMYKNLIEIDCSGTPITIRSFDYLYNSQNLRMIIGHNIQTTQKEIDEFSSLFNKKYPNCMIVISKN